MRPRIANFAGGVQSLVVFALAAALFVVSGCARDIELERARLTCRAQVEAALARQDYTSAYNALRSFEGEIGSAEARGVATAQELQQARNFLDANLSRVENAKAQVPLTQLSQQIDEYIEREAFGLARSHLRLCIYGPATSEPLERHCQKELLRVESAHIDSIQREVEADILREAFQKARGYLGVYVNAGVFSEAGLRRLEALQRRVDGAEQAMIARVPPPPSPPSTHPVSPAPPTSPPPPPGLAFPRGGSLTRKPEVYGLRFVYVPPGAYTFGTPKNEVGRDAVLEPEPRRLHLDGFFISTTEVTQEAFARVIPTRWTEFEGSNIPAHSVTFEEAKMFSRILTEQDGDFTYSLPTEIEWEVACRARSAPSAGPVVGLPKHRERFLGGRDKAELAMQNYAFFVANKVGPGPRPVKQKIANALGLYDMHGNVAEWCLPARELEGWYGETLVDQPIRGGSVLSTYERCRAGARALEPADARKPTIGFRIIARPR